MFDKRFRQNSIRILILFFFVWAGLQSQAQFLFQPDHFLQTGSSQITAASKMHRGFIQVPVRIGGPGLTAVSGFHFYISYDNQKLQFAGVTPGAVTNVAAINVNGVLSLQYSNIQAPINCTQQVILFYLNFTRLATGDVPLTFLHGSQVAGMNSLLPVTFQNGMVLQTWQLSLESSPAGAGVLSGAGEYLPGQSASVSAVPNPGYHFINWTKDGQVVSTQPDFDFTMPAENVSLTANFGLNTYMVQVQANPSAGGTVSGAGAYAFGQTVNVQAVPNIGWAFTGWMLDGQLVSTQPDYTFTMPASNLLLWANFEQLQYPLQLTVNPAVAGTVSGAGSYVYNAQVTVQATPNTGWSFTGWTQDGQPVSSDPVYTFSMPASALNLQANFEQILYPLQLTVNPEGTGTVSGAGNYPYNTQVTVQAVPEPAYNFMSWNQGSTILSTNPTYTFAMPAASLSLVARFSLKTYQIQVSASNPEHGTVSGGGIYTHGQTVTVSAQANAGYQFVAWTEQGQTVWQEPVYSFTALANRSLVAVFQQILLCPEPVALTITEMGEQFAAISWVSPASIDHWDLIWGVAGFDPATGGTLVPGLTQPAYTITGLNPQTAYDVYVRAWCENTHFSQWAGPLQFMTWYVGRDETTAVPRLFPNPATTHIRIERHPWPEQAIVEILSADGRLMGRYAGLSSNAQIDVSSLANGVYYLYFIHDGRKAAARFVIIGR